MSDISYLINLNLHTPERVISELVNPELINQIIRFHQSIPDYQLTPLINLKELGKKLNIDKLFVKDESFRFELNAFKMLGCSYAMAICLAEKLGLNQNQMTYPEIAKRKTEYADLVFVTATDGNHGRAVAWSAKLFGCHSQIYMPSGSSIARLDAIRKYTEHALITDMGYDDTVAFASQQAELNHWLLIQDTAWPGYREIPDNIMRGYFSLLLEFENQACGDWPTHIFLQAGVGSMAAAITAYLVAHKKKTPKIILVEPTGAPCFYQSMKINDGSPHRTQGELNTIMAGLACGEPSISAWEILSSACFAFIVCNDSISLKGMRRYAAPIGNDKKIVSGESGAVTLGLVETILADPTHAKLKLDLQIDKHSKILLLSTEGNTDPDFYSKVIDGLG